MLGSREVARYINCWLALRRSKVLRDLRHYLRVKHQEEHVTDRLKERSIGKGGA